MSDFPTETTTDPIDAYLCQGCGQKSWKPVRIEGAIDDGREADPTYFFMAYLECQNCKEVRVVNFVGARPNISLGSVKKIVRPDIESEAAKESRKAFVQAAMRMH